MTTLTVPARRASARNPGHLDMLWNTWRQHRFALIGLLIVFAGFALRLAVTAVPRHAAYSGYLQHHGVTERHPVCGRLLAGTNGSLDRQLRRNGRPSCADRRLSRRTARGP